MPSYDIIPRSASSAIRPNSLSQVLTAARTSAALNRLDARTLLRSANAVGEGTVSVVKVQEVVGLVREAMSSHVGLSRLRDVQAGADPILHAELGYYLDIFRLAAGEIANDLVNTYCRESRGLR